ncbi:MAG: endonuclease Q family protein [Nanoarchaeota archaeon]|nr:endonuclease Q family protein [Nanoarchaeota archaeon]
MTKFHCANCNFSWIPKTQKLPTNCPYCGKATNFSMEGEASFTDIDKFLK